VWDFGGKPWVGGVGKILGGSRCLGEASTHYRRVRRCWKNKNGFSRIRISRRRGGGESFVKGKKREKITISKK